MARPLAGLGLVVVLLVIFAVSIGLFAGKFTETVPVTVISDRAGLVMNPDAKVKMRGVQVGSVKSIQYRPDGKAELQLDMDPSQMHLTPSTSRRRRSSAPTSFSSRRLRTRAANFNADRCSPAIT